jgi:group I intron endonuclease
MRTGIIYLITNRVNGKKYVGQSVGKLRARWKGHKRAACRVNPPCAIHKAIRKYGLDAFTVDVISEYSEDCLDFAEIFFIKLFNTYGKHGYNMTAGGESQKGRTPWNKGKKTGLPAWNAGKKGVYSHSPETRENMSRARMGIPSPMKGKPSSMKGKAQSPEAREKMRAAWKRRRAEKLNNQSEITEKPSTPVLA